MKRPKIVCFTQFFPSLLLLVSFDSPFSLFHGVNKGSEICKKNTTRGFIHLFV